MHPLLDEIGRDVSWISQLRDDAGARCNAIGLTANTGLAVLKFTVGTLAMSEALIADGFNSAGDIVATTIAFAGYAYARQPADDNHHFGHGNADNVAGMVVGGILLATGVFISIEGARNLIAGTPQTPTALALAAALVTAAVKEGLYRYTTAVGRRVGSHALLASARDHRADVFIAITVFAGVLGARAGLPWLDPATACAIGGYIAYMAWEPIRENLGVLMDEAPPGIADRVFRIARSDDDVREVGDIRVHPIGAEVRVELALYLDGSMSLHAAHLIAHRVESEITRQIGQIYDVHVHVNPTGGP